MSFGHMRRKNWKKICEIEDPHFRTALALLDMNSEFSLKIINSRLFGDYFEPEITRNEENGYPVPLSVLFTLARASAIKSDGYSSADTHSLFWHRDWDDVDINIPIICFATGEDGYDFLNPEETLAIPDEIMTQAKEKKKKKLYSNVCASGQIFTWQGKEIVLLEDGGDCEYMVFAPGDCIAVDK
jgi:hypothetical protein